MRRALNGPTKLALVCVGIWALGLLFMWLDFHYGSHVWDIKLGPVLIMLAMLAAVPTLLYCVIAWVRLQARGLPAFTKQAAPSQDEHPAKRAD